MNAKPPWRWNLAAEDRDTVAILEDADGDPILFAGQNDVFTDAAKTERHTVPVERVMVLTEAAPEMEALLREAPTPEYCQHASPDPSPRCRHCRTRALLARIDAAAKAGT